MVWYIAACMGKQVVWNIFCKMPTHDHARMSAKEMNFDPVVPNSGCILKRDKDKLKEDISEYIDMMAEKTKDGDGCIESDLVETMFDLFKSAFVKAARSSSRYTSHPNSQAAAINEPIAIDHTAVRRVMTKIGQAVVNAMGDSDRCIPKAKVAELKQKINNLLDHPPPISPSQAMASYRKFVESKYARQ